MMHLTGTFRRSVDQKLRIAIPKRLRSAIEPTSESDSTTHLYVAPGTDGSLAIYSEISFSRLAEKLAEGSPAGPHNRAFSRLFYARAHRVEMDSQGRIRIDPELAELAALEKDVVMVGVGDRIELWNEQRWEDYTKQQQANYDQLAERAFEKRS